MKKIILSFILSTVMILSLVLSVSAGEEKCGNFTRGTGTITKNDILVSNDSYDYSQSAFGSFKYYKNDSSSDGTVLMYTSKAYQNCYPKLASGKYFTGVYTPANDYRNYNVKFAADLNDEVLKVAQTGGLQIYVGATTKNKDGSCNDETGIIGFQALNSKGKVIMSKETNTGVADGTKQVSIDWKTLPKETTKIIIVMRSERHGLGTQWKNRSNVTNPYVYFRDVNAPYIVEAGIVENDQAIDSSVVGTWKTATNSEGKTFKYKTIGEDILYYVKFNEPVLAMYKGSQLNSSQHIYLIVDGRDRYKASILKTSGEYMYFKLRIPDSSNFWVNYGEGGLSAMAPAMSLIIAHMTQSEDPYICDYAGNRIDGNSHSLSAFWQEKNLFVDDTAPGLAKEITDENGVYPAKYLSEQTFNVYGELPKELVGTPKSGTSGNQNIQPTIFSSEDAEGDTGMIFRIVLRDKIKTEYLNENTRLKLNVYTDSSNKVVKNLYATLVAARYIGSDTNSTFGVKNNIVTEMFFRYDPKAEDVADAEIFYVQPALYNLDEVQLTFNTGDSYKSAAVKADSDLITTTDNRSLETNLGMKLDFGKYPYAYGIQVTGLDTAHRIMVDTKAPQYAYNDLPENWVVSLDWDNSNIYFSDSGELSYDGAQISVYYIDDSGTRQNVRISINGSDAAEVLTVPTGYKYRDGNAYYCVSLANLAFPDGVPDRAMYVEYSVKDRAGNTATNKGENNIVLNIDRNGPVVNGSEATVSGTYATVKYDVEDKGVESLSPYIYYRVEKVGEALDTTTHLTQIDRDNEHTLSISGKQNAYDTWRVWANFGDSLGNRTKVDGSDSELLYTPSDEIEMADRSFKLWLKTDNMVAASHTVTLGDSFYISDKDGAYTINLYYKWVKGSTNDNKDTYKLLSFTDYDSVKKFNFADESVIKSFVSDNELIGEYTLFAYAQLLPENEMQYNIVQSIYFDKTAPTISVNIYEKSSNDGKIHNISYSFSDDAENYKLGYYVTKGNINLDDGKTYLEFYFNNEFYGRRVLSYINGATEYNMTLAGMQYLRDKGKAPETLYYQLVTEDKCGNKAVFKSDVYDIDLIAPELGKIQVNKNAEDKLILIEDGDIPLYAISNFSDIKNLSVTVEDNLDKRVTVSHKKSGYLTSSAATEDADVRNYVYNNPILSDYTVTVRNNFRVYRFTIYAEDHWGNISERSIDFIWDQEYPEIEVCDSRISPMTADDSRDILFKYSYESYEEEYRSNEKLGFTIDLTEKDGSKVSTDTAEIVESTLGMFTVRVYENCEITARVTDAFGKYSEANITVDNFDRMAPEIKFVGSEQTPASGAAKYGSIEFSAVDNIGVVYTAAAIVPAGTTPGQDDYFSDNFAFPGSENNAENISAGNHIEPYATAKFENNKISYYGLPTGTYDVYVEAVDNCGNTTEEHIITISTDSTGAALTKDISYAPTTATAGQVIVTVNTDVPVARIYETGEEGSIAAMHDYINEMRETGFTYVDENGNVVKLTDVDEIVALYNEIAKKYDDPAAVLTDREKEIYKNLPAKGDETNDPYFKALNPNCEVVETADDILDYLHNIAFYSMGVDDLKMGDVERVIDPDTPRLTPYLESMWDILGENGFDSWEDEIYNEEVIDRIDVVTVLKKIGITGDSDITAADGTVAFADTGLYNMNVLAYPTEFDNYAYDMFVPSAFAQYLVPDMTEYVNPFFAESFEGVAYVTAEQLKEVFGNDVDLALFEYDAENDDYAIPFDTEIELLSKDDIEEAGLEAYIGCFEAIEYYTNPFVENDKEYYSTAEMEEILRAVNVLKKVREKTVETVADKYVSQYMDYSKQEYTTVNTLRYSKNVDTTVKFIDRTGQILEVPVKIDWIDDSLPHIPENNIVLTHKGEYGDEQIYADQFVNDDSVTMTVTVPNGGIYEEYYLTDLPEGAVGIVEEDEEQPVEGVTLYKGFTLEVKENSVVVFGIVNPTASDSNKSQASQSYLIDCFDREAPTAELVYSPAKPDSGTVNTDVSVSITNISDNRDKYVECDLYMRKAGSDDDWTEVDYYDAITDGENTILWDGQNLIFSENNTEHEFKFYLCDQAGNKRNIKVGVDYIDKTPVEFSDVKLYCEGKEIGVELADSDTADYMNSSYEYEVTDTTYYGKPLTVEVYIGDEKVASDTISTNDEQWKFSYTAPNGNSASLKLTGFLFDTMSPNGYVNYELVQPGKGEQSYVNVVVTVFDDNLTQLNDLKLVNVSGRLDNGTELTAADVKLKLADDVESDTDTQSSAVLAEMTFKANGFADLVFEDQAGNQLLVQVDVREIDRTVPKAYIDYSSEEPTNHDVQAMIFLTEAADYMIMDMNNRVIKDYADTYSSVIYYTFKENQTLFFQFRDIDGNTTEPLIAYVGNIDRDVPKLELVTVHQNTALDMEGNLVNYMGAATIELKAIAPDILTGGENDTVVMLNANQSIYHTVMENGTYTFTYGDKAGNFGFINVDVVAIDTIAPAATITGNPTAWTNVAPEITIKAIKAENDNCSCENHIVMNGRNYPEAVFTPESSGVYSYVMRDDCGNTVTEYIEVKFVDLIAPEITFEDAGNLYIYPGEFASKYKEKFEKLTCTDEGGSGLTSAGLTIDYGNFDADKPGEYPVTFTVSDNAGNTVTATKYIYVIGEDDVFVLINDIILIPGSQTTFWNGEELELSFLNAESCGDKISYAFEKGYFNGAEMKGTSYKKLTTPNEKIKLEADEKGMYTLFVQTENRKTMVMYVFVAGASN